MPRETVTELQRRIAALEAENARLRASSAGPTGTSPPPPAPVARKRSWSWTVLATVLIVIGAILAPVSIVASWAKVELTDTDRFVAEYGPLAKDAAVQRYVTDQTVTLIDQHVDISKVTSNVIDGITSLGTGPAATSALDALKGPIAQGIRSLIASQISDFVKSDAFANIWAQALRLSHSQLVATMQNNPKAAIALGSDGSIGIQIGPIIDQAKKVLEKQGLGFVSKVPTINRTITVAQSDSIPTLQTVYNLAVAAGSWMVWVALAFLIAGVIVARRRSIALIWAAVALALSMAIVLTAFASGRLIFVSQASPSLLPSDVADLLYRTVVQPMHDTAVAVLVLALVVAVVAWFAGPFDVPRRLRALFGAGAAAARRAGDRFGITTGPVGRWMYAQRVLLRVSVAVIAAVIIVFTRPLTPALIVWTLVIAVVVIALLELAERPSDPIREEITP
jgi:hypothetical protein